MKNKTILKNFKENKYKNNLNDTAFVGMSCSCFTGESFPVLSSVFHHAIASYVTHVRLSPFQLWTPVQPVYFSCWLPQGTSSSSTPSTPWGGDTPPSHPSSLPSTCLLHYCRYRYVCTSFYNIVRVSLRNSEILILASWLWHTNIM